MKKLIGIIALTNAILVPLLLNIAGWNIYAYLNFGERDLIIASANGVSHNAWAEHYEVEDTTFVTELPELDSKTIIDIGFLNFFLERRSDQMTPFTFRVIQSDEYSDYRGVEFPWLLLLLVPVAILVALRLKRGQNRNTSE